MQLRKLNYYIKFISALLRAKITKCKTPLVIILGVTNQCNLKCRYCYGEHSYRNNYQDFTTEELLDIVRGVHRLGTQILQLQGGEPLLRDDLRVIIDEVHRLGMSCDMVTNGTLIHRHIETLRLLDKICISFDGPFEINDRNRGKETLKQAIEGVKLARSYGLPVRISAVLTPESSRNDIDWLVNFAHQYDTSLNFSPSFDFVPHFNTEQFKPQIIPDEQMRELFGHIIKRKREGFPIQFTAKSYNIAISWPFTYRKIKAYHNEIQKFFFHPKCYHGDYVVFIDSDGSVYPCCNFWGRPKWNIREHGLESSILGLDRDDCEACYIPSYIDRNLFFDGNFSVWINYIIQAIKGSL